MSELKKFRDKFKCPICNGQIDIAHFPNNNNYGCVYDNDHYSLLISPDESPSLIRESLSIYDHNYKYVLTKAFNKIYVLINQIDGERRIIDGGKGNHLLLPHSECFKFTYPFDSNKAINKIRTIMTFS